MTDEPKRDALDEHIDEATPGTPYTRAWMSVRDRLRALEEAAATRYESLVIHSRRLSDLEAASVGRGKLVDVAAPPASGEAPPTSGVCQQMPWCSCDACMPHRRGPRARGLPGRGLERLRPERDGRRAVTPQWRTQPGEREPAKYRAHAWRPGEDMPVCGQAERYRGPVVTPLDRVTLCSRCMKRLAKEAA